MLIVNIMGVLPSISLVDDWCTKIFNKKFGRIKVPVHLEKINRPLGAMQAKLNYYKVPAYMDNINRPLGATGVDIWTKEKQLCRVKQ